VSIESISSRQNKIIILLALIVLILAAYWQVQNFEFLNYDDNVYVTDNYRTQRGLSLENVISAFVDVPTEGLWHPLTLLSHMMDWQLFGGRAGGHHWSSLIIHIINTVFLFILLNAMTGALWKSAIVAALFAIHPLNVESVAWVAERKNVLSTFFWMLTMLCYVWYVKQPGWKRYLPVFICFALGLMSKPMLVTLPFVLLLMDYWPLDRGQINGRREDRSEKTIVSAKKSKISFLILEKVPLFILAAINIVLTLYASQQKGAIAGLEHFSVTSRIFNALVSYVLYIKKLFLPIDLAAFYPYWNISIWQISLAVIFLIGVTVVVCLYSRKYPYLPVGWFWYLGTLVPVLGLIQVGSHAMADRCAYVPLIGIFLIVVWGMSDVMQKWFPKRLVAVVPGIALVILFIITSHQVQYWKNTIALFEHTLNVTGTNFTAHMALAGVLLDENKIDEAIAHYNAMLLLNPKSDIALVGLGQALSKKGESNAAIAAFRQALKSNPKSFKAHYNLGFVLFLTGNTDEAIVEYQRAIALNHDDPSLHNNLGNALVRQGKVEEAIREYSEALHINPEHAGAHNNLAMVFMQQGRFDEAIKHFREATRWQPKYFNAHYQLAILLKKKGLIEESDQHYQQAVRINPDLLKKNNIR